MNRCVQTFDCYCIYSIVSHISQTVCAVLQYNHFDRKAVTSALRQPAIDNIYS